MYNTLISQPTATVTIDVTCGDESEATVSPEELTFTGSDWDEPQTVTVTGVDDGDSNVTISHSASGGGYNGVSIAGVTVTDDASAGDPGDPNTTPPDAPVITSMTRRAAGLSRRAAWKMGRTPSRSRQRMTQAARA